MRPIVFVLGWLLLIIMLPLFRFLDLVSHLRSIITLREPDVAPKPGDMVIFDQDACHECGVIGHRCPNFVPPPSMWYDPDPMYPPW